MSRLNNLSIAVKLPLLIGLICVLLSSALTAFSYYETRRVALDATEAGFAALIDDKRMRVTDWYRTISEDLLTLAHSATTHEALLQLDSAFSWLGEDPAAAAKRMYVDENPHPLGQRQNLAQAPDALPYNNVHGAVHPGFLNYLETKGYYDIFLFNSSGDLVYSVVKEADYGTNFRDGEWADSGLGQAFRSAADGAPGQVHYIDFEAYAPSADAPASFISTPILGANGAIAGVLAFQMPIGALLDILAAKETLGETGEVYIVGADGLSRTASRLPEGFQVLDPLTPTTQAERALAGETAIYENVTGLAGEPVIAFSEPLEIGGVTWALVAEKALDEVLTPIRAARTVMILVSLALAAAFTMLGMFVVRRVTGAIGQVGEAMRKVSYGELDAVVEGDERGDEIGAIARILQDFQEKLVQAERARELRQRDQAELERVVKELSDSLQNLAKGDLRHRIDMAFAPEYEALRANFNETVDKLDEVLSQMVDRSFSVAASADDIGKASDELSNRTETQAATLEQTAAAMDQLTVGVKSAAERASSVEEIVATAQGEASGSSKVVQSAVEAMSGIEESSSQISQIISVIDDIAFQTNLLALNAGVEAARAGEAGKGFAVVASEVRALAHRSSEAATEIKDLIVSSNNQVRDGAVLVDKAGAALRSIIERVADISFHMKEIAAGASEQSSGISEINLGVNQLDQVTQQNAAMVEESTAAAHILRQDADALRRLVSGFSTRARGSEARTAEVVVLPKEALAPPPPPLKATGTDGAPPTARSSTWEEF